MRAALRVESTQLFNFQSLAGPVARSSFLLFTQGSRCRLFINQSFLEQSISEQAMEDLPPNTKRQQRQRRHCKAKMKGEGAPGHRTNAISADG
jgi:hypothetical protein